MKNLVLVGIVVFGILLSAQYFYTLYGSAPMQAGVMHEPVKQNNTPVRHPPQAGDAVAPSDAEIYQYAKPLGTLTDVSGLAVNDEDKMVLTAWERARGYDLITAFVPSDVADAAFPHAHPYTKLPLDVLLGMATNGDATAQLFYGLNLKDSRPEEAVKWLRESVITGGYSGPLNHISTLYSNQLLRQQQIQASAASLEMDYQPMSADDIKHHRDEAYKWAVVGYMRNDIHAEGLLNNALFADLDVEEYVRLQAEAEALYQELNDVRMARGFIGFNNTPLPEHITQLLAGTEVEGRADDHIN